MNTLPELLSTLPTLFSIMNGVVVATLAIIVIPRYLREKHTGRYIGFRDRALLGIYLGWAMFSGVIIVSRFGTSIEALLRILATSLVPFLAAFAWVKLTDAMGWDKIRQIRR